MMRKTFDLSNAEFSDDSDEDGRQIPHDLIEMYNRDYSLILSETKNFFSDCKDFLTRFISLNNMGIGFNLPLLLNSMMKVELKTMNSNNGMQSVPSKRKEKFENTFMEIMEKMGHVISEMLNFQVKIKSEYLGEVFNQSPQPNTRINKAKVQKIKKQLKNTFEQQVNNDAQQRQLRNIFHKSMTPTNQNFEQVCNEKATMDQNLDGLLNKMEKLRENIQSSRKRQQKIWSIFETKRPSRSILEQSQTADDLQKQRQYKHLSDMLSDIVSQKSRAYGTSFDTVESSFNFS